jgi:chromosome segregation ATPase
LDELLAERERAQVPPTPPPALSVDPVVVPDSADTSRRALRQRLADLETAARRNYRSAEEARRVLADEHQRLEQELSARTHAQHEAAALRREVERLSQEEAKRGAQERSRAERAARAEIADELQRFHEEHERAMHEVTVLRSSLSEHDGLLDEYVTRLRDEQGLRAELRAELDRAEAARSLAERSLLRATENARHGAEDEMIRLATAEQQLADARSDRDRLAAQLSELTAGDGPLGRMTAQLQERDDEIGRLQVRIADLSARIDASEEAAHRALVERDNALRALEDAQARLGAGEQARADADLAVAAAAARISELESGLAEHVETTGVRSRELDRALGNLRKEAREASNACRAAEAQLATVVGERDAMRARAADLMSECDRLRSDSEQLRAHAAALGDELAAARSAARVDPPPVAPVEAEPAVVEVPVVEAPAVEAPVMEAPVVETEPPVEPEVLPEPAAEGPPPLPLRIAGRHAPAPPLAKRRTRTESARSSSSSAPALAALARREPEPAPAEEPPAAEVVPEPEPAAPVADNRRTALAAFTSLATSSGDDFTYRRH